MATVTCTRPNASECINGIRFDRQPDGSVVAHGVSDDAAALFAHIPGYVVTQNVTKPVVVPVEPVRRGRPPKS